MMKQNHIMCHHHQKKKAAMLGELSFITSYFMKIKSKGFSGSEREATSQFFFHNLFHNIFTVFPSTSCLSEQLTLCTWCSKPTLTFSLHCC